MEAAQDAAGRPAMVVLDKRLINPGLGKDSLLPGLHEKTAMIAKEPRLDQHYLGDPGRSKFHRSDSSSQVPSRQEVGWAPPTKILGLERWAEPTLLLSALS